MATIGYAVMPVIPSIKGISDQISRQIGGPLKTAGRKAGTDLATEIAGGVNAGKAKVEKAAAAVAQARVKEADAAGKVRSEEAKLQALRDKGIKDAGRLATAEERVASAKRHSELAAAKATTADKNLTAAKDSLEKSTSRASKGFGDIDDRANKLGGTFTTLGSKAKGLAPMLLGTVGMAGVAAGFKQALDVGNDLTNNLNTMRAVGNATDAQLAAVSQRARELGNDISLPATSATDATAAMVELAKGGFKVEQAMAGAKGTLQLAAAAQISATEAATVQSQMLQAFGKDASYASNAADILANAANESSAEIMDVAQGMQQAGAVAHLFKIPMEDASAALAMLANAGIKGSDAGTLIKSALLKVANPSEQASGAMRELGLKVYDAQGKFIGLEKMFGQLQAASKRMTDQQYQQRAAMVFGSDAMRLTGIAAAQGAKGFDEMRDKMLKAGSASKTAASQTKGLPGAIERAKNAFEELLLTFYDLIKTPLSIFLDILAKVLGVVSAAIGGTIGFLGRFSTAFKIIGVTLTAIFLPAMIKVGVALASQAGMWLLNTARMAVFNTAFIVAKAATVAWTGAQWLLNAALSANPIGIVVMAIAALIAGLVLAYKNSETFRNIVHAVWNGIKVAISAVWSWIQTTLWPGIKAVFAGIGTAAMWLWNNAIKPAWTGIKFAIQVVWFAIQVYFKLWSIAFKAAGAVVMWLWNNAIRPAFQAIGSFISAIWNGLIKPVWNAWTTAIQWVGDKALWLWQAVMVPAWEGIKAAISAVWNFIKPILDNIGKGIEALGSIASKVGDAMRNAFNGVVEVLKVPIHAIGRLLASVPDKVLGISVPGAGTIRSWGATLQALRAGGPVRGPGGPRDDQVLLWGSNGEFMQNAKAVDYYGPEFMAALNARAIPREALPAYKDGGMLGQRPGEDNLKPPAVLARRLVYKYFPQISEIGGYRAQDPYPDHPSGRALDIMIPDALSEEGKKLGTAVRDWLHDNKASLGLNYLIWQQMYEPGGNPGGGNRMEDRGSATQNHLDHLHVLFDPNDAADPAKVPAGLKTPSGSPSTETPETNTDSPNYQSPDLGDETGDSTSTSKKRLKSFKELGADVGGLVAEGIGDFLGLPSWVTDPQAYIDQADKGDNVRVSENDRKPKTTTKSDDGGKKSETTKKDEPVDPSKLYGGRRYAYEIAKAAKDAGLSKAAATIGEATALVETNMRMYANSTVPESLNLPHDAVGKDHDSVGLFQQRASWGSVADRMDAYKSAKLFYAALVKVPGWESMEPGAAAQAVQKSAFPGRYSGRMGQAAQLVEKTKLFDTGGVLRPGQFAYNGLKEPEHIIRQDQWARIDRQTDAVRELVGSSVGGGNQQNITIYGNTAGDIVTEFRREQWRGAGGYGSRGR